MTDYLFKGIRAWDPANGIDRVQDIAVHEGFIATERDLENPVVCDGANLMAVCGITDLHVHLRDPGQLWKETIATGTAAAEYGGFNRIVAMPNTNPAIDTPERMMDVQNRAAKIARCEVIQSACLTQGRAGQVPTDIPALKAAGCRILTDDGSTPQDTGLMRDIMAAAAENDLPVIDHCELTSLSKPGVMHEGAVSRQMGLPGQPRRAEIAIVERDLELARETGCVIHLQHLSCRESVALLADARKSGLRASGEATPHHLLLTDQACLKWGTLAKMAPPLREEADRLALIQGLADGVITCIATDHAPHTMEEKKQEWSKAPFGITGIEVVIPLCLTYLVKTGMLSMQRCIEALTLGPAALLGAMPCGFEAGTKARFTVIDTFCGDYTYDAAKTPSMGVNCPWTGFTLSSKVTYIG